MFFNLKLLYIDNTLKIMIFFIRKALDIVVKSIKFNKGVTIWSFIKDDGIWS